MVELKGKFNKATVCTDLVDETTIGQVLELLNNECSENANIVIMPDCHTGAGCVIGTTMTIHDKVVPNLVGVDIGCGMLTVSLGKIHIDFEKLDRVIRKNVPSGQEVHKLPLNRHDTYVLLSKLRCFQAKDLDFLSLGTLGGGNHFIEIDTNEEGDCFLIIHSGSRNLGKRVAEHYQEVAIKRHHELYRDTSLDTIKKNYPKEEWNTQLKKLAQENNAWNKDLAYLEGQDLEDYLHDMRICQEFALRNRHAIAKTILVSMRWKDLGSFTTTHNYIEVDAKPYPILRKGAISAKNGELAVIPINMRDGVLLVKGKGNTEYNLSAPHGAGRILSRSQAKKQVSVEEFSKSMEGIYSSCIGESTLDESPMVYKPIEAILDNIQDMVEVVDILKPIYNFKAS